MKFLHEKDLNPDAILQFFEWYEKALHNPKMEQANATCLSTLGAKDFPSARMVLLKSFDHQGFVFYTNYHSKKSREMSRHPKASLNFYWEPLGRQVRITGRIEKVGKKEADAYFQTRPRLSQIGAWASRQSEVLKNRAELDHRFAAFNKKFKGKQVPRPPHWGGFRLIPHEIEFWQAGRNRLHDRFLYTRVKHHWRIARLNP